MILTNLLTIVAQYGCDAYGSGNFGRDCDTGGGLPAQLIGLLPNTGGGWALFVTSLLAILAGIVVFWKTRRKGRAQTPS